jgi:hypothetical protein
MFFRVTRRWQSLAAGCIETEPLRNDRDAALPAPKLRMLRLRPAQRRSARAHLHVRMHLLRRLRRETVGWRLSQLRRRSRFASDPPGGGACAPPRLHRACDESASGLRSLKCPIRWATPYAIGATFTGSPVRRPPRSSASSTPRFARATALRAIDASSGGLGWRSRLPRFTRHIGLSPEYSREQPGN